MLVNPVRIVYISDTALCITDPDGDGLYYYNYYDRSLESVVFALTDHEYTKANKQKYSNADLYSYRTEKGVSMFSPITAKQTTSGMSL